ncbi:hypothetical protein B0H14DRAFT_3507379 [Mycena olivaceomarginata]|nr:hypothetical protein B0H14DRAFT_3507379 [Mycena olivaceomarginata]
MSDNESINLTPLTDDERASSVDSTAASASYMLVPCYSFSYPTFKLKEKAPPFQSHPFWNALLSASGCPLTKLAVVCRHPKFKIDEDTADGILNEALPAFHLAASTLNTSGHIPLDITVALSGITYLAEKNKAISKEWQYFPFPETDEIPACALGASPPRVKAGSVGPSKDAINNAPHLSMRLKMTKEPSPVADSPPSNPSKRPPAKKRKAQPKAPKSLANIDDGSSEDEAPPSKRAKTSGKGKEAEPSTPIVSGRLRSSTKAETAAPKPKKALGSVDEQIEAMIPEIREKLREMMTEKKKQGFRYIRHNETHYTLTLSAFQGHRTYIPNNMFGPVPPPKEKGELPKEPLVKLVRFSAIEYEQVLQPPGACLLCLMYGITCNPTAFGLACTHCNQKKMHTLCDHTWRADKVCEVMGGIEEIRGIMFPDAPIVPNMIPHLMDQVSTAHELYSSLRNDLTDALRAFFTSIRNYVAVSGEEAFRQEFKSMLPHATARGQINTLIHAFNHYNNPKTAHLLLKPYELSDDEKDDAGPSKSPSKKVVLKEKEPETAGKEDGEVDEDAEGEEEAAVEREHEAPKSSPCKKHQRSPSE